MINPTDHFPVHQIKAFFAGLKFVLLPNQVGGKAPHTS
jgi:hypothetical protein